jgi:hypothetical protein
MAIAGMPEGGELHVGSVALPAGRRIVADHGRGDPVAWATIEPLPNPGRVWAALSQAHKDSGLVPFLLSGPDSDTKRPWENGEFGEPEDTSRLDHLDPGIALAASWHAQLQILADNEEEDPDAVQERAPYSRRFPGLAPAEAQPLSPEQLQLALDSLPAARIGLVPATRPAEVLPRIGWLGLANWHDTTLSIAAVLRSWEERFGARLLEIGLNEIRLLVERPPSTAEAAQRIAAEHYAICDECAEGLQDIASITTSLVNAPTWAFLWY